MFAGPTTPYASVEHGNFNHIGYTGVFNILDYSVVSFPCGVTAHRDLDKLSKDHSLLNGVHTAVSGSCKSPSHLFRRERVVG